MNRTIKLLILLAALTCALPVTASANDYLVYSCRLPDGRPAPADGWSPVGDAPYAWFGDGCPSGGALRAGLAGDRQEANRSSVGWGFDAGDAAIRSYSIVRSGRIAGHVSGASTLLYSSDLRNVAGGGYSVDYCAAFAGCTEITGRLDRSVAQVPSASHAWFFMVGCGGITGVFCVPAAGSTEFGSLRVDSASFRLSDDEEPQAETAAGSLTEAGATSGTLEFTATDAITGIHRAAIEVDGVESAQVTPNSNGGRCVTLGLAGSINDFAYRRPCPQRQQVELSLAAGVLAPGPHLIRARVYDASGNGLTVFGPRLVSVASTRALGQASQTVLTPDARSLSATYGKKVRVAGTLRSADGAPVAAARIDVVMHSGATAVADRRATATTDGSGRYELRIKASANRELRLRHADSGTTALQELTVSSALKLRAKRSKVAPLGRLRLAGSIPTERTRRGASVAIKVKSGRGWRAIGVVRANTRGRFEFNYRFRRTRHGRFRFRAVALRSSDLAVNPRTSRTVTVRVG